MKSSVLAQAISTEETSISSNTYETNPTSYVATETTSNTYGTNPTSYVATETTSNTYGTNPTSYVATGTTSNLAFTGSYTTITGTGTNQLTSQLNVTTAAITLSPTTNHSVQKYPMIAIIAFIIIIRMII
jgi:hypothetical protein